MTNDDQLCVSGCCELETTDHLFLNCNYFGSLWNLVRDLLGFLSVDPRSITEHFVQYAHLTGGSKMRHSFMHLISFNFVWVIWNERNDRIFIHKEKTMSQQLDMVKHVSL